MSDLNEELFKGLDIHNLIEGPLTAACEAQTMLAASTEQTFSFQRGILGENGESIGTQTVHVNVPMLSIVPVPSLSIDDINITFDMEVKSSEGSEKSNDKEGTSDGGTEVRLGPFSADVKIKGSIVQNGRYTKTRNNSAKYKVTVRAAGQGVPEGAKEMLEKFATASSTTPWEQINNSNK